MAFTNLQVIADELRCSVLEAAEVDPEWRDMALVKLVAQQAAAKGRVEPGAATAK